MSPGIIVTPLAYDEFNAPGNTYQGMIDASPARRTGTIDEIAAAGAFLLGPDAGFITGTDLPSTGASSPPCGRANSPWAGGKKEDTMKTQIAYNGARGTYRMKGTNWFEMRDGNWISVNAPGK